MSLISIRKLKKIAEKNKETFILDLGKYVDKRLDGVSIPIKVKTYEETLQVKAETKLKNPNLTITYAPFTRLPKKLRELYMKDDKYRTGQTENTYFQVLETVEDSEKIDRIKYRERLFNILIHLDMDYSTEEGTLWEESGITKNDYNTLIDTFSGIIQFDTHLDILDLLIDSIKSGNTEESHLQQVVAYYGLKKYVEGLDEESRIEFYKKVNEINEESNKEEKKEEKVKEKTKKS